MTISECIARADNQKPNQYSVEDKLAWLSALDSKVFDELIMTHEFDPEPLPFIPYTNDRLNDNLIAKFPYEDMYVTYLKAKVDEMNEETDRYNNTATIFNSQYNEFAKYINRHYLPKTPNVLMVK